MRSRSDKFVIDSSSRMLQVNYYRTANEDQYAQWLVLKNLSVGFTLTQVRLVINFGVKRDTLSVTWNRR